MDTLKIEISYDPAKREQCLAERKLDFESAAEVFAGSTYDEPSKRPGTDELRIMTVGFLKGRMVMVIWTPRAGKRHVISMRKCNEQEWWKFAPRF